MNVILLNRTNSKISNLEDQTYNVFEITIVNSCVGVIKVGYILTVRLYFLHFEE